MFHLHLHTANDDLPAKQVQVADCCRGLPGGDDQIATITADEPQARLRPIFTRTRFDGWDHSSMHEQNLRLLRKLVDDANACERMRAILQRWSDHGDGIMDKGCPLGSLVRDTRAALAATMPDAELNAKLTSDRVIDGLARDITLLQYSDGSVVPLASSIGGVTITNIK